MSERDRNRREDTLLVLERDTNTKMETTLL